jgi:hypothetical protein
VCCRDLWTVIIESIIVLVTTAIALEVLPSRAGVVLDKIMDRSSTRVSTLTTRSSFSPHSPTFSRASTIFHRPIQPPVGPRLRHRASNINTDYSQDSPESPREDHFLKSSFDSESQEPLSAPAYDDHVIPPSRRSSHRPHAVRPITQPPKFVPAPVIKFDSIPVPWKGLPLEAALCTSRAKITYPSN